MDIAATLADDWQYYDDRIDVELIVPAHYPEVAEATYAVANVVRESVTQRDFQVAEAKLDEHSRAFHLWTNQIASGQKPGRGDLIRDTDDEDKLYQVVMVERCDEGMRFRCVCNRRMEE